MTSRADISILLTTAGTAYLMRVMASLVQTLRARTGLLSVAEVSPLIGFHVVTVRNWARAGRIPAVRIAGQWRFDPAELAAWVLARKMG